MKVAVYTIALNEAAHAERWANSAADADYRIVADTGSTDGTVERLTASGVTVHKIAVRPWRFDVARNAAMALIPADVDVCCTMDMDRFLEPGWRAKLEAAWTSETTALFCRVSYRSSVEDPTELRGWPAKNFHHRWGYRFKRPVHEALVYTGEREVTGGSDGIIMAEVQDHAKSTRRQYLSLMELAHKEDPVDAQICFWLGREFMWAGQSEKGIVLLERYLALPSSTWNEERSEAMRYLARMQPDSRMSWLDKARMEAAHRREIWLDMAEELHDRADWLNLFWACVNGIEKTHRTGSYLDDSHCWGFRLFDLGAIASWHLHAMDRAVEWGQKALELDPNNSRLKDNLDFFVQRRGITHSSGNTRSEEGLSSKSAAQELRAGTQKQPGRNSLQSGYRPYQVRDDGTVQPIFNPLVYTVAYGPDEHFECLALFLKSLVEFGGYPGRIAIFSDRDSQQLSDHVPSAVSDRITMIPLNVRASWARYSIPREYLEGFSPILYVDNDIIVDDDINALLREMSRYEGMFVTNEKETYRELCATTIAKVQDTRRIGNWFGLELARSDPACSDSILPIVNSGIFGVSDYSTYRVVGDLVCALHNHPQHIDLAKYFGDQPFFNYALLKTGLGIYHALDGKCSFAGEWRSLEHHRRGFAHFVWARGKDKVRQMKSYMEQLQAEEVGTKRHRGE